MNIDFRAWFGKRKKTGPKSHSGLRGKDLLQKVRETLRKDFGFPRGDKAFGVGAVFSPEPPVYPARDGTVCAQREQTTNGESLRLNCDTGFGTATFVTGTFGFVAAGRVVSAIAGRAGCPQSAAAAR